MTNDLRTNAPLYKVALAVVSLPIVFIIFYSFGGPLADQHVMIRLAITMLFAVLTIKAIQKHLDGPLLATLPKRAWAMIGLLTLIALSRLAFGEDNFELTTARSIMWLIFLFLGLTLYQVFGEVPPDAVITFVLTALVGASVLYVMMVAIWFIYDGVPTGTYCANMMPGFRNVRYTAYFSAPALGFAIFLTSASHASKVLRVAAGLAAVGLWTYLEYTGARGAVIALIVTTLFVAFFLPLVATGRLLIAACVTFGVAMGLAWFIPTADCPSFGMINRLSTTIESDSVTTGRVDIWRLCMEMIRQRPVLGHGEIKLFNYSDFKVTQPHNFVLQSLLAWGFVGAGLFFILLGELAIRLLLSARKAPWQAWPVLFGTLTIVAYGQISGALYHAFPLLFATILIAASAALIKPRPGV